MHPQNLRPLRRRDDRRGLRAGLTRLGLRPARDYDDFVAFLAGRLGIKFSRAVKWARVMERQGEIRIVADPTRPSGLRVEPAGRAAAELAARRSPTHVPADAAGVES